MQLQTKMWMRAAAVLLVLGMAGTSVMLTGCKTGGGSEETAARSEELTPGEFPDKKPSPATPPPPPQLRSPETAVYSYLLWISYAYRVLDSTVASPTFSPYEEVRVDSYVQLNRQEGRAIDQRLLNFQVRGSETKGDTATVGVTEDWRYRYIDITSGEYKTPAYDASYDSTYTVVKNGSGGWFVEKVEVQPRGEVK